MVLSVLFFATAFGYTGSLTDPTFRLILAIEKDTDDLPEKYFQKMLDRVDKSSLNDSNEASNSLTNLSKKEVV